MSYMRPTSKAPFSGTPRRWKRQVEKEKPNRRRVTTVATMTPTATPTVIV